MAFFISFTRSQPVTLLLGTTVPDIVVSGILIPYHLHMFIISGSCPSSKTHVSYLFHRFQNTEVLRCAFQHLQILLRFYIEQLYPFIDPLSDVLNPLLLVSISTP